MRMPGTLLKEKIAAQYAEFRSRKLTRFIEALLPKLTKPEYGSDGLLMACEEVFDDPVHDFEGCDRQELVKRLIYDATFIFPSQAFADDFRQAAELWLRSPRR